jgi:hypothetical protein
LQRWTLPSQVVATILWLGIACWSWSLLGQTWLTAMQPRPDQIIDFYQDWGSARNHRVGLPIYTHHSISIPRHLGLASNPLPSIEYNAHPPTAVILVLPLAWLEYPNAAFVWNVISLAAFVASVLIMALVLPAPTTLLLPGVALLPFCVPVFGNLQMGQLTPILALLVTASWALERTERSTAAGLLLGFAAAIKLFPAYLAVYYLARRRLKPLLTMILSFFIVTLATAFLLGFDAYHDYVQVVLPRLGTFRGWGYNCSVAGFWHKLFDPAAEIVLVPPLWPSLTVARYSTLLTNLAITVIAATLACRARNLPQRDLAFASVITAMLLVTPMTWEFSLLLLLVPIAVIAHTTARSPSPWILAILALILPVIWLPQIVLMKLVSPPQRTASLTYMLGIPSVKFYTLLLTFLVGLASFPCNEEPDEQLPNRGH